MTINEVRAQIDDIDNQIINLFSQRLQFCRIVGELKRKKNMPIFNQLREQEILNKIAKADPLNSQYLQQLYHEIFKICKDVQSQ